MDKNIQMTQRNAENTGWDNLNPKTIATNVKASDGSSVEEKLAAHATSLTDYSKLVPYAGTTTGSANAYVISTPSITELVAGMAVCAKINVDSTGASTLNWCAQGAKAIKKANGASVTNLKSGGLYTFRYDGVGFILQGEGGSGNAVASDLRAGKTASTDAGDITGTFPDFVNSVFAAYTVAAGETISAGDFVDFINDSVTKASDNSPFYGNSWTGLAGGSSWINPEILLLDDTRMLFVYNQSSSGYSYAVIATINKDNTLTLGTPVSVGLVSTYSPNRFTCLLSDTSFVVAIQDSANNYYLFVIAGSIVGSTITFGTAVSVGYRLALPVVRKVTSTKAIIVANYATNGCHGIVCTVSGTVVTLGTRTALFPGNYTNYYDISIVDDSRALVVLREGNTSYLSRAFVVSISGLAITLNSSIDIETSGYDFQRLGTMLPGNKFLLTYLTLYSHKAVILTVDGLTVSKGMPVVIGTDKRAFNTPVMVNTDLAVVLYGTETSAGSGYYYLHLAILSITNGSILLINNVNIIPNASVSSSSDNSFKIFSLRKNEIIYGSIITPLITTTGEAKTITFRKNPQGFAMQSGSEGQSIQCYDWR